MKKRRTAIFSIVIISLLSLSGCGIIDTIASKISKEEADYQKSTEQEITNQEQNSQKNSTVNIESDDAQDTLIKRTDSNQTENSISTESRTGTDDAGTDNVMYLNKMVRYDFDTQSLHNNYSPYEGQDRFGNFCRNAIKYQIDSISNNYPEQIQNSGTCGFSVSYDLGGQYHTFSTTLTQNGIADCVNMYLYADEELLYYTGLTIDTHPLDLMFDITGKQMLRIEFNTTFSVYENEVIFSEAKLQK